MWWRLGILGAVTAALLFFVFAPITTVSVKVDLPPTIHPASAEQAQASASNEVWAQLFALNAVWIAETAVVIVILGIAGWIAWRIVRRHRNSNRSIPPTEIDKSPA
jgi:hypothetical protein